MEITLFCYQYSPNRGEPMFFAETLEQCRKEAVEQRAEFKDHVEEADFAPFPIYECVMRMDLATYIEVLNCPEEAVDKALVSKKLIGLVME